MLGLVLRLIFVFGTDGAGTGAVWGAVAIILMETAKTRTPLTIQKSCQNTETLIEEKAGVLFSVSVPEKRLRRISRQGGDHAHHSWVSGWFCVKGKPHLFLLEILHPAYKCQIEADSETVLEEEGGSAAVELSFGDDGDAVAQQVGLVHVMSGQNHCPACTRVKLLIKCFFYWRVIWI